LSEFRIDFPFDRAGPGSGIAATSTTVMPGDGPIQSEITFAIWRLASTDPQDPVPVPEPGTLTLAALGLLGLGTVRWRRRRR